MVLDEYEDEERILDNLEAMQQFAHHAANCLHILFKFFNFS